MTFLNHKAIDGWDRLSAEPATLWGLASSVAERWSSRPQPAVPIAPLPPPVVQLIGQIDHADFREAVELLRHDARPVEATDVSPELIVIAQSRPGAVASRDVERLRRGAPLASAVGLLGTWCEGGSRTGRPWPGVTRLYWYEFPAWWRRQLRLRAAGRCPDWSRPVDFRLPSFTGGEAGKIPRGLIELCTPHRETADALTSELQSAAYATVWQRPGRIGPVVRGAVAGIWEGGQLDEREERDLARFCRKQARDAAPVVALLDFPRRERMTRALELGAAAVLGKPWLNQDLLGTIEELVHYGANKPANRRAA